MTLPLDDVLSWLLGLFALVLNLLAFRAEAEELLACLMLELRYDLFQLRGLAFATCRCSSLSGVPTSSLHNFCMYKCQDVELVLFSRIVLVMVDLECLWLETVLQATWQHDKAKTFIYFYFRKQLELHLAAQVALKLCDGWKGQLSKFERATAGREECIVNEWM